MSNILEKYKDTDCIKNMSIDELNLFAGDIRRFLVKSVSETGGHLASNLGVVELTLSLYQVFNLKKDKLVWDVGHQCYVHKILTGRKDQFTTLRKFNGLSGFPKRSESKFDHFQAGHSSTSISAALGMARARDLKKQNYDVVAVIGDGALTGGMALEALNDVGYNKSKMIIILNDNQMSIGKNVGGLSTYLSKVRIEPGYNKLKKEVEFAIKKIPNIGGSVARTVEKIKNGIKQMLVPGMFFENMGLKYLGPIDGHNIKELTEVMSKAKRINGPVIIHVVTKKGRGYKFAEKNPGKFHGIGEFDYLTGETKKSSGISYSKAFGDAIVSIASEKKNVVAITAAMKDGTGLKNFQEKFKERFFDVGIAEQHAVTMAAGMAASGLKPVFAVYSTFLQRAYDQVLHDVCIQKLPVVFAIDRAGIVGADGETHQGVFDISYLSHLPNMTIIAPKCVEEMEVMLRWAVNQDFPVAIRYPRGGDKLGLKPIKDLEIGKWETLFNGEKIHILATGRMVQTAIQVRDELVKEGFNIGVINANFIKPLDNKLLEHISSKGETIVTIEDNILSGGFGNAVLSYLNNLNEKCRVINLGFEDKFIPHGNVDELFKYSNLDVDGITNIIKKLL